MADVAEEYRSSLSELSYNSKPHINMLTMIAEENIKEAPAIVQTIVDHINTVQPEMKLPAMYLVDSIIKNIGKIYIQLFSKTIVPLFTSVFEKVDENVRSLLYKLRATWTGIFPNAILLRLDRSVINLDPAWPLLAQVTPTTNIHVNPKFLDKPTTQLPKKEETVPKRQSALLQEADEIKKKQLEVLKVLQAKKQQLLELKRKAASATAAAEYLGVEAQKNNSRDPRLSKKGSTTEATTLQSVVIVPKSSHAEVNKKNDDLPKASEKLSLSPERKRQKLLSLDTSQRDLEKSKDLQNDAKFTSNQNHNNDKNVQMAENKMHIRNQNNKNKKHAPNFDNSVPPQLRLDKNDKMSVTSFESKVDTDRLLKRTNMAQNISNQPRKKMNTFNRFPSEKESVSSKESNDEFKQQFVKNVKEEAFYKNNCRMEPPPSPPLLFGSEDKDYRTLVPAKKLDSDERILNEPAYQKSGPRPVVKSFKLDNKERKVYFVNDRSFAVMDDNVPRELSFEGPPKLVFVEGLPKPFELHFGGHKVKFEIDGQWNTIQFGTPAQEVFINHCPYEAQFGGPPFTAVLENGKMHRIRISGPPPQVVLSKAPAYDLYYMFCRNNREFLSRFDSQPVMNHDITSKTPSAVHDVDMRVNTFPSNYFNFPVEKVNDVDWQRMPLAGCQKHDWNVPKNSFETSRNYSEEPPEWNRPMPVPDLVPPPLPPKQMINRAPLIPDLPPQYAVPLPVKCSSVKVSYNFQYTMSQADGSSSVPASNSLPSSQPEYSKPSDFPSNPQFNKVQFSNTPRLTPPPLPPFLNSIPNTSGISGASFSSASITAPIPVPVQVTSMTPAISVTTMTVPAQMPARVSTLSGPAPLPALSGPAQMPVLSLPMQMPSLGGATQMSNMSSAMQMPSIPGQTQAPILSVGVQPTISSTASTAVTNPTVNVDVFLEKLVAAGIIGKKSGTSAPTSLANATTDSDKNAEVKKEVKEEILEEEPIPEIVFEPKCLKKYYPGVINALHNGSQCATCGMRFKEMQSEQYSHHLDWHFRMNRREKDGAKKPFSRRLYYEVKDWVEFKEFEEVDERAPSYFELQASGEQSENAEVENVCSVPSTECESETCAVCSEQFQLFWVEEEEEWHLRNAVKHDGQVYHPACYEDYKKANESMDTTDFETSMEEMAECVKTEPEEVEDQVDLASETIVESETIEEKTIKEEPMDTDEVIETNCEPAEIETTEETDSKSPENEKPVQDEKLEISETDSVKLQETVNSPPTKSEDSDKQSKPPSPVKNVPANPEEEEEVEFRPPTPDPRFQVLEPVTRGTELSALCVIM